MNSKPNILLIMADQFRADWMGCAGTDYVETPHIDSLAKQGTRFTRAICNSPLCAPSRTSLAAGLYPHRIGAFGNDCNLPLDQPTFYQALRRSGYRVGVVGKTDLHKADHQLNSKGNLPIMYHFGFTDPFETEGKMNAAAKGISGPYQHFLQEKGLLQTFMDDFGFRRQQQPVWYAKESVLPADAFHDTFIAGKSCELLENFADSNSPWHLSVNFVGPHDPWDPPAEYLGLYADKQFPPAIQDSMENKPRFLQEKKRKQSKDMLPEDCNRVKQHYAAAVKAIDDGIGAILNSLTQKGLRENTIVIFCADHGEMLGDHGLFQKSVMYEGALRVPFLVSVPGQLEAAVSEELVELVDLYPTILDLAGADYLPGKLDGKSILPLLKGEQNGHKDFQVSLLAGTRMIFDGKYKYIHNYNDTNELYDLENDPQEMHNLISKQQEIATRLSAQLSRLCK